MDEETKKARYSREVEQSLRQFLNHDGPKGSKEAYREGWDRTFGKRLNTLEPTGHRVDPDEVCIVEETEDQPGEFQEFARKSTYAAELAPCDPFREALEEEEEAEFWFCPVHADAPDETCDCEPGEE